MSWGTSPSARGGADRRRDGVGEAVEDGVRLFVGDGEGWQQPDDGGVPAAQFDDQAAVQAGVLDGGGEPGVGGAGARGIRVGGAVDELDAEHQPAAADVTDAVMGGGEGAEAVEHPGAEFPARRSRPWVRT